MESKGNNENNENQGHYNTNDDNNYSDSSNNYFKNRINEKYKKSLICFGDNCCSKTQQECIRYSNKIIIPSTILTEFFTAASSVTSNIRGTKLLPSSLETLSASASFRTEPNTRYPFSMNNLEEA